MKEDNTILSASEIILESCRPFDYPPLRKSNWNPPAGDSWEEHEENKHIDSMLPKQGILKQIEEGVRDD